MSALLQREDLDLTEDEAIALAADINDRVPIIDQVEADAPPVASYRDWRPQDTRVVTYTNDPERYPKDRVAESFTEARAQCELVFGRILETNAVPGRWFFRVRRINTGAV